MRKETKLWTINDLARHYTRINFPEYQREPNVWSKAAKQRLIDSIVREFDIASIYLYEDEEEQLDCIDGRQRIGAIMSFLCKNPDDKENCFPYRQMNEIFEDDGAPFEDLQGLSFDAIEARAGEGSPVAEAFVDQVLKYRMSVVHLSGSRRADEFNLQFTRLNLGTIINSGEKLHAMVGDLREVCFEDIGKHAFLESIGIPTRRYAKEQVAAQILAQVFSLGDSDEYARTRHYDLQLLFKKHTTLDAQHRDWVDRLRRILDLLEEAFTDLGVLKNRALTVSTVLLAWQQNVDTLEEAKGVARFIREFVCRLRWQLSKGYDFDREYQYLIDFQRDVTQASVERPAVERRAKALNKHFDQWRRAERLAGDAEYEGDPAEACREAGF